jgi:hypothetical protein
MNDIKIRSINITLDKPRNLVYDLNAFEELENIYGNLDTALNAFSTDKKKISHIKNFLFAGLVHEDSELTPKRVGEMIGYSNITETVNIIWEAITNALPEPKEEVTEKSGEQ